MVLPGSLSLGYVASAPASLHVCVQSPDETHSARTGTMTGTSTSNSMGDSIGTMNGNINITGTSTIVMLIVLLHY